MKEIVKQFKELAVKKQEVKDIELQIRNTFADEIQKFFADKGYPFEEYQSSYSPMVRYYRPVKRDSDKFGFMGYDHGNPELKTFARCYFPTYTIKHNTLTVVFNWWKLPNVNITDIWWNPEKETLEELYNRTLKKILKLL